MFQILARIKSFPEQMHPLLCTEKLKLPAIFKELATQLPALSFPWKIALEENSYAGSRTLIV